MKPRTLTIFRLLFVSAFVGITVLSVVPAPTLPGMESDKLSHLAAYMILTLLLVPSLAGEKVVPPGLLLAVAGVLVYGAGIEVLQHFIGRQFDLRDMAANAAGVLLGIAAGLLLRRAISWRRKGRESR
ncbi:MAG: VanZ family protein [Spirochaetales bacterium]|nr:MAG: VanZ family protein [Spirochaetales bacterium]